MIKAEDLRIGDLVRVNCNCALTEGTIGTIVEISKETNSYNKKRICQAKPY
nr:MAG TPA: 50S ribosomal protein L2 [Caudoviricetes sp.]